MTTVINRAAQWVKVIEYDQERIDFCQTRYAQYELDLYPGVYIVFSNNCKHKNYVDIASEVEDTDVDLNTEPGRDEWIPEHFFIEISYSILDDMWLITEYDHNVAR